MPQSRFPMRRCPIRGMKASPYRSNNVDPAQCRQNRPAMIGGAASTAETIAFGKRWGGIKDVKSRPGYDCDLAAAAVLSINVLDERSIAQFGGRLW